MPADLGRSPARSGDGRGHPGHPHVRRPDAPGPHQLSARGRTHLTHPDATIRTELGKFAAAKHDDGRDRTLAVSILLRSGLVSGAVRAILWFVPQMEEGLTRVAPDVDASIAHFRERGPGLIDDPLVDRLREVLERTPSQAA